VVEIVSPSSAIRDWRDKLDLYARYGVREYWLLSPEAGTAWVFMLDDGSFREVGTYGREDSLNSPTLPGFKLDLADVFV
jgi:Uma2 family endonuclease